MPRRRITRHHLPRIQTEHTDIILAVQRNQLVPTELDITQRRLPCGPETDADPLLPVDVDHALVGRGLVGADGEEGLDWVVGEGRDLGGDAVAGELGT